MSKDKCQALRWIIILSLLAFSCSRPLFVSHLSAEGIAMTKKKGYGMPSHSYFSRFICFDIKCRNKAAWVKEQKNQRFKGYVDNRTDKTPEIEQAPEVLPQKKDSVVAVVNQPTKSQPKESAPARKEKTFVLNEVLFEHNSAKLNPVSSFQLDSLADLLMTNPKLKVKINGYTDNTGKESRNLKLSRERAQAVAEYLIQKGTDYNRISFEGFGSADPIADNNTEEGRRKNRRVEIHLLGN